MADMHTPLPWRVDHFFETFRILHNLNFWDLEEAGVITPGAKGDSDWKRFNGDLTTFMLKLPSARVEKLFLLVESRLPNAPSQDAETIKALRRPGTMVLLDGRNEHGSHVIPMLPTNLPPEFEEEVGEVAEEIIKAAEALGFEVGDVVWTEWFWNEPQVGEFDRVELAGYWEFVCVNADVTRALAGSAS